jgi:translation initiation factor 3 subunit E
LGLNQDEGEKWIVNLIRDTRMDGKLDYQEGTVLMNHPANSVYQQVSRPRPQNQHHAGLKV